MAQYGFYFNADLCTSCKSCAMACKDKNNTLVGGKYRSVVDFGCGSWVEKDGFMTPDNVFVYGVSYACMHCTTPACITSCPVGSIIKREEDGIVFIDEETCIGCDSCITACPYSAPRHDQDSGTVKKCNFCIDLIDQGEEPVCVTACTMRALEWGEISELREKYGSNDQIPPLPVSTTGPNYVVAPHRMWSSDIQGTIINAEEELL